MAVVSALVVTLTGVGVADGTPGPTGSTALTPPKPRPAAGKAKAAHVASARKVTRVNGTQFGIHSFQGRPGVPAGTFRMNCHPTWRDINPAPGVFEWAAMDAFMDKIESYGYKDIVFAFCATPEWAAKTPLPHPEAQQYYGPLSSAPPANMSDWRDFVSAVASRYHGRIYAYETWNEATSRYMWQGTAEEMAEMTAVARSAIKAADPAAKVVSANMQTIEQPGWFRSFFPRYARALAARGWPIDAIAVHTYAGKQSGSPDPIARLVTLRAAMLKEINSAITTAKVPKRVELWDTETNYMKTSGGSGSSTQQALIAHTYLDSWRYGLRRTYWYMWTLAPDPWLGVPLRPGDPAVGAFTRLRHWTSGTKLSGCAASGKLVVCSFTKGKKPFRIAYSDAYTATPKLRLGGKRAGRSVKVCPVTGTACKTFKGKRLKVGYTPVRIS